MNLIYNNPFRILGLPITATEREIAKQINTLSTYAEMGKVKSLDTDFVFLQNIFRTPEVIDEAKKQIENSNLPITIHLKRGELTCHKEFICTIKSLIKLMIL